MIKRHSELLRGTLETLILETLRHGPAHGFAVARWLEQVSDEVLQIEEGSLYPALHRMERRGWLDAEWGVSENNRQVKCYRLTSTGRRHLKVERASWLEFTAAVTKVFQTA